MQRLKLGLVCLTWLLMASAVSAQTTGDPTSNSGTGTATLQNYSGGGVLNGTYFNVRQVVGDGVGWKNSYSQLGLFTPFWINEDNLIASNVFLTVTNSTQTGVNAGLVGRTYVDDFDRLFGVYGYYDNDQDSYNFRYNQMTVGAETLGNWWDLRANGYFVTGMNSNFMSAVGITGGPFYVGNNIAFAGQQQRDQALSGGDVEFGVPLSPYTKWLRGYAGVYGYQTGNSETVGFRGRIEAMVSSDLTLNVMVTQDPLFGTNVNGMIDFKFSGFLPTRYFPNITTRQRMLNPVQRNWRIATHTVMDQVDVDAINPATNQPYFITHVLNTAAPGGNGTIEHPYNHLVSSPPADIILVHLGTASTLGNAVTGSATLTDNQRLLSTGILSTIPVYAQYGGTTLNGTYNLPGTSNSGLYPYVTNAGGNIVTLANNNEVAGLNLIGAGGSAITNTATGSNNFNLHNLEIAQNAGYGVNLTNASGSGILSSINVGTTDHANPLGVGNNALGGIQISAGTPGLNLQLSNVYMNSSPPGSQAQGISLTAANGYLNAYFNNVFTNGNAGGGIQLSETGQSLTAMLTSIQANGNGGVGVQVSGTGGSISLTGNDVAAIGNGSDNLQIGTQAAPVTNAVVNVTMNNSSFSNSTGGSGVVFSGSGSYGTLNLTSSVYGNNQDGLAIYATNSSLMNASVTNSNFVNNGVDAFHVLSDTGSTVNLVVDPTNASGSGNDGLYYNVGQNATFNGTFQNSNLNNSGTSAVYGLITNFATANIIFSNTTGANSGANGFYLNATNNSIANINIQDGTFQNSGLTTAGSSAVNISSDNSMVTILADNTIPASGVNVPFGGNISTGGVVGNQAYGLTLNIQDFSTFTGTFQNGDFSNALTNAINASVLSNSNATLTLFNTNGNNSGADGFVANVNNAMFTANLTSSNLNNNVGNGANFTVANSGIMIANFNSSTINTNDLSGINFNVNGATLNINDTSSSISNNGAGGVMGSGVLGVVTNSGTANLDFLNMAINNNLDNGVFVTTNTGANINAIFDLGTVIGNGVNSTNPAANNNDGIRLVMDDSTSSSLSMTNGVIVTGNGNNGVTIEATGGTQFTGLFQSSTIQNNGAGASVSQGAGVYVTSDGQNAALLDSNVFLTMSGMTIDNTAAGGTQQFGLMTMSSNSGQLTLNMNSSLLSDNANDAINATATSLSTTNLTFADTVADSSGATGALINVTTGATLNFTDYSSGATNTASITSSGGSGILASVDGANSVATFDIDGLNLNSSGLTFGGQGFFGVATNGGTLNAFIANSNIQGSGNQGIEINAANLNTVARFNVFNVADTNNGSEGLLINVTDQAAVYYRSIDSQYSQNGANGTLDGVQINATGNGALNSATVITLFSGDTVDNNSGNGFSLNAANGATMTTSIDSADISNNGGYGIFSNATGANTSFNLLMTGANTLNGNTLGPFSPLTFTNINQAVIEISGSFNNSPGDGVQVTLNTVVNALVAVVGPGTIDNSTLDGINVSMTDVTNGSVLVSGLTEINNSGGDGIDITFNTVANGAIGINGSTNINDNGGDAINISLTSSTLVDNLTFGTANITVLTLTSNIPEPLNGSLPLPVNETFDSTGLVPTGSLTINEILSDTSANTGFNIVATNNTSIGTLTVSNNTVSTVSGVAANSGDGIYFDLASTTVQTLNLISNSVGGAKENGVNFDLNASPIGALNIQNNTIGVGGGGGTVGDTLPIIVPGFTANTLAANDDGSTGLVPLGFTADFFGTNYNSLYVNNNGNVTFTQPLAAFTPFSLLTSALPMIAPFFADVDTRSGNPVTYGTGTIAGHAAFGVDWVGVDHYDATVSGGPPNTFQLVLIDRSDIAPGDFDIEFNYTQIQWEAGAASGGNAQGLGGESAIVGYTNGTTTAYQLPGSAVDGALLDTGPAATSLIHNSLNSINDGRYIFDVRGGIVGNDPNGADGIRLNAVAGSNIGAFNAIGNTIENSGKNGVELLLTNSNLENPNFTNNTISSNGADGIRLVNPTTPDTSINATFQGNTISSNTGTGVNLQLTTGGQNLTANFGYNTISSNAGGPGVDVVLANNASFTGGFGGNTISSNGAQGVNFTMGTNGNVTSNFVGNTIDSNKSQGINFSMGTAGIITSNIFNNTISGNGSDGIAIALGDAGQFNSPAFYGNTIGTALLPNGGMGVDLTAPGASSFNWALGDISQAANLITGNANAGVGITMTGSSTGTLVIENSTFSNTTVGTNVNFSGQGLSVIQQGTSVLQGAIVASTFTGNAGDGAEFSVTGNDLGMFAILQNFTVGSFSDAALGNTFSSNTGNGLEFVRTADGEIGPVNPINIGFNTMDSNTLNGLSITAANKFTVDQYTIDNNDFSKNTLNGVKFDMEADANISANMAQNTIENNTVNGILTVQAFNAASDERAIEGTWMQNTITGNKGDGIDLTGVENGLIIGNATDTTFTFANVISNNSLNGIEVDGPGTLTIGNNILMGNGQLAALNTAAENAAILMNVDGGNSISVLNNMITNNFGDGVQYQLSTLVSGFEGTIFIDGNYITNNAGRGINVINRTNNLTQVDISDNEIAANGLEGVYIVNTASADQTIWAPSTTALLADGNFQAIPEMQLRVVGNEITGNGVNSGFAGTGLVVRVGSAEAFNTGNGSNPGGFAQTNPATIATDASAATFFSLITSSNAGVIAQIDSNTLGGNFGNDIEFDSFTSTVNPPTSAGAWNNNFTATPATITFAPTSIWSDPLSRFDLYYRDNVTDTGSFDPLGVSTKAYNPNPANPALAAFYNNAEGTFKSATAINTTTPEVVPGPFFSATRPRNATREGAQLSAFSGYTLPPGQSPPFLFPGMGASTWRVSTDSVDGTYFVNGFNVSASNNPFTGPNYLQNPVFPDYSSYIFGEF